MEVSRFIKVELARYGFRQRDIAVLLGITPQALSQRMQRGTFSFEELEKIANLCGCHFEPRFVPIEEGNRESD